MARMARIFGAAASNLAVGDNGRREDEILVYPARKDAITEPSKICQPWEQMVPLTFNHTPPHSDCRLAINEPAVVNSRKECLGMDDL